MDKIKNCIERGELETAKKAIRSLERQMESEPSQHMRGVLKTQILELRKLFASKMPLFPKNIANMKKPDISEIMPWTQQIFSGNEMKPVVRGISDCNISEICGTSIDVINCDKITVEKLKCKDTIHLRNVKNATIRIETTYLRLSDCEDLQLNISQCTGIFLQNSQGIRICLETGANPSILDFSSPLKNVNFCIIS